MLHCILSKYRSNILGNFQKRVGGLLREKEREGKRQKRKSHHTSHLSFMMLNLTLDNRASRMKYISQNKKNDADIFLMIEYAV